MTQNEIDKLNAVISALSEIVLFTSLTEREVMRVNRFRKGLIALVESKVQGNNTSN